MLNKEKNLEKITDVLLHKNFPLLGLYNGINYHSNNFRKKNSLSHTKLTFYSAYQGVNLALGMHACEFIIKNLGNYFI